MDEKIINTTEFIPGYKGFRKGLKGRDKQYAENQVFEKLDAFTGFEKGLYFCESPIDVLNYYPPSIGVEYTRVTPRGLIKREGDKSSTGILEIGNMISTSDLFNIRFGQLFNEDSIHSAGAVHDFSSCFSNMKDALTYSKGWVGHAVTAGRGGNSATTGRGGHAVSLGSEGGAFTRESGGHAYSGGAFSCASTVGPRGHAVVSGRKSHAHSDGFGAHSHSNDSESSASTSGKCSHATSNGIKSYSHTEENWSHSVVNGMGSHSSTCGKMSNAVSNGQDGLSNCGGEQSIALSAGIRGKAAASEGWIIIVDWRKNKGGEWYIFDIHKGRVGQWEIHGVLIKPDTWYWFEDGILKYQDVYV